MKFFILIIATILSVEIFAQDNVRFDVNVEKDTHQILDPIIVNFLIENIADSVLSLNYPHPMSKHLSFTLSNEKKELVLNEWYVPEEPNKIKLDPYGKQSFYIDITRLYPFIEEGDYTIKIKYYPFHTGKFNEGIEHKYISIDSINFRIATLPLNEKKVKAHYYYMLNNCADVPECIIAHGEQIIEKYPSSIFVKEMKYQVGNAYTRLTDYDKAIEYYKSYLEEKEVSIIRKNSALWYIAWAYYKKENTRKALDTLLEIESDNMNRSRVNTYIEKWREELRN